MNLLGCKPAQSFPFDLSLFGVVPQAQFVHAKVKCGNKISGANLIRTGIPSDSNVA